MHPRASVILTVYKRTTFLREAIDSVLAQSFTDFEIVVADDSGTAGSREIVESYADPRIRFRPNPVTLGVVMSLRGAIEDARGDFIAILNDDDVWEKDLLGELIRPLIADPAIVASFSDHWLMREDGSINEDLSERSSKEFRRGFLPRGIVEDAETLTVANHAVSINISAAFRKDALDLALVVPQVTGAYDYWISCILAASRRPLYYVPLRLARWRQHSGMETKRRSHDKGENMVYIFSQMRERGWFPKLDGFLKQELAHAALVVGRDKMQFGRLAEARRHFWLSFTLTFGPRALLQFLFSFLPGRLRNLIRAGKEKAIPADSQPKENSIA